MFENLEWRLIAKDEASASLKKVTDAQREAIRAGKESANTARETASSWTAVLQGVAAWDIAKAAAQGLAAAVTNVVQAGIEQEASMARVRSTLESVGLSYEASAEALAAYSDRMVGLGFNANDAEESLARLMATTKDAEQAQKLAALAADFAADKNITLGEATNVLTKVYAGNTMALKQYGIDLDETADAADAFAAMQDRVGGRAEAMADTTEGAIRIMRERWNSLKDQIGLAVLPTLKSLIGATDEYRDGIFENKAALDGLSLGIYKTTNFLKGMGLATWATIKTIASFALTVVEGAKVIASSLKGVLDLFFNLGDNIKTIVAAVRKAFAGDFAGAADELKKRVKTAFAEASVDLNRFGEIQDALGEDVGKTWQGVADAFDEAFNARNFQPAVEETKKAVEKVKDNWEGVGKASETVAKRAAENAEKVKDGMAAVGEAYKDASEKAAESLAKLEVDHAEKTAAITDKLKQLKASLEDVGAAYQKSIGDINKSEAERVIAQEQTIKSLQAQIAELKAAPEQSDAERKRQADLEAQLAAEQAAYDRYVAKREGLETELTEARRRASLTDFERFIEDINARRTEAEADHAKKVAQIKAEIDEQEAALVREQAVFEAKRAQYLETQQAFGAFHADYVARLGDMKAQTQETVDAMKAKLAQLKDTLAQIESVRNQIKDAQTAPAASIVPATGGGAGSVRAAAGPVSIEINLGGVNVGSNVDADALIRRMGDELKRQLQLAGLASA